jgi:hypothetical protein
MFTGNSRITLAPNSRVTFEQHGENICVYLAEGSVGLALVAGAKFGVCGKGQSLVAQTTPYNGDVTVAGNNVTVTPAGSLVAQKSSCASGPAWAALGGAAAGGGVVAAMGGPAVAAVVIGGAAVGATVAGVVLTRGDDEARSGSK